MHTDIQTHNVNNKKSGFYITHCLKVSTTTLRRISVTEVNNEAAVEGTEEQCAHTPRENVDHSLHIKQPDNSSKRLRLGSYGTHQFHCCMHTQDIWKDVYTKTRSLMSCRYILQTETFPLERGERLVGIEWLLRLPRSLPQVIEAENKWEEESSLRFPASYSGNPKHVALGVEPTVQLSSVLLWGAPINLSFCQVRLGGNYFFVINAPPEVNSHPWTSTQEMSYSRKYS